MKIPEGCSDSFADSASKPHRRIATASLAAEHTSLKNKVGSPGAYSEIAVPMSMSRGLIVRVAGGAARLYRRTQQLPRRLMLDSRPWAFNKACQSHTAVFGSLVGMDNHGPLSGAKDTPVSCLRHAIDGIAGVDAGDCRQFGAAVLGSLISSPIPILLTCLWPTNSPVPTT